MKKTGSQQGKWIQFVRQHGCLWFLFIDGWLLTEKDDCYEKVFENSDEPARKGMMSCVNLADTLKSLQTVQSVHRSSRKSGRAKYRMKNKVVVYFSIPSCYPVINDLDFYGPLKDAI